MESMRIVRVTGLGLALALLAATPAAGADPRAVDEALRAYRDGALSEAMAAFERALDQGGNDRASLAVVYLHLGVLRAGARDPDGATRAFEALLALDPAATPPAGSSPLVTEPFARARARRGDAPALGLDVRAPEAVQAGADPALEIIASVRGDTASLAAEARVAVGPGMRVVASATGAPRFRLSVPGSAIASPGTLHMRVTLHDGRGSVLDAAELTTRVTPTANGADFVARADSQPRPGTPPRHERTGGSLFASPWFWGGVGVVVAGAVTAALVVASSSDRASFGNVEVVPP